MAVAAAAGACVIEKVAGSALFPPLFSKIFQKRFDDVIFNDPPAKNLHQYFTVHYGTTTQHHDRRRCWTTMVDT
jgi:hypothetical protein